MATVMAIHTTSPITKRRANLLVRNFLDQIFGRRTGSTALAKPNMLYGLLLADPVQWAERRTAREPDEEACICHSADRIAGMGANQIAAQERDGACRSLCAHWPDRRRQTGLFDEVRKFAGPAATASAGRNQCATGSGAGSATKRVFRSVLRKKETGRIGAAFSRANSNSRRIHGRIGLCWHGKRP